MAGALGFERASLCSVSMYAAHLGYSCPSSGPIRYTGLNRRVERRTGVGGLLALAPFGVKKLRNQETCKSLWTVNVASNEGAIVETEEFGEPISLGTMKLPSNIDLKRLETLLFQWANSLTQSANMPLSAPIKVDKVKGGIRLGFIRVNDGKVEDLVHIDCLVSPATEGSNAVFRALRNGKLKNETPPGEPAIMTSLLQALKKSIDLATI